MKDETKAYTPYIPAEKKTPELTVTSLVIGILLAAVFAAGTRKKSA